MTINDFIHDEFLKEDLTLVAIEKHTEKLLAGHNSVLITGATGLVGSLIAKSILQYNDLHSKSVIVNCLVRNVEKAATVFSGLMERNDLNIVKGDITDTDWFDLVDVSDLIFHCAAVTTSKIMVTQPVETIYSAILGTKNMLDFAVKKNSKQFLYVSSMEVYGTLADGIVATEDQLGNIDNLNLRSNYPESKRMCENMCVAYSSEYGIDVRIARLAQTFGAGILPWENRVFAQFARSAIKGEDIVLHTRGLSEGNYCYSRDMLTGLFTILTEGETIAAYNVVNEATHTTIGKLAELAANTLGNGKVSIVYDIPESNVYGFAADTKLKLSGKKLESLGWNPEVGLAEAFIRMAPSCIQ